MSKINKEIGTSKIIIESGKSDKRISFSLTRGDKMNIFTNFKPFIYADILNSICGKDTISQVMEIEPGKTYGMVMSANHKNKIDMIPIMIMSLNKYEHKISMGQTV